MFKRTPAKKSLAELTLFFRKNTVMVIALLAALAIGSLYGITDEWHQLFVPSRSCDPADWAVDTVATLVGSALTRFGFRKNENAE